MLEFRPIPAPLAAILVALALAGCGSSGTGEPRRGGSLSVAFSNEPTTLDPAFSAQISSDRNVLSLFYDSLLGTDQEGRLKPRLATRWKYSGDGRTLTLTLRQNVKFSDGTAFDAKAAASNLERVIDPELEAPKGGLLASVDSVSASGADTLRLELGRRDPLLLTQLASEPGMMVSPKAFRAEGEKYGRRPVGTGPFVLEKWTTGTQLRARRNPRYWRKASDGRALPRLDEVTYRFITDSKVALAELRTGGAGLAFNLDPTDTKQLSGDPAVEVREVGRRRAYYVALNTSRAPFDDLRMRQAFLSSIDRDAVGRVAAAGDYELAPSFATRDDWFYDGSIKTPARDPARAKALVQQAGGSKRDLDILVRNRPPDPKIAELLQAQLAEGGLQTKVEIGDTESVIERALKQDFDALLLVIDVPRLDPSLTFGPYFSSSGANNWSKISDPELDDLLERAAEAEERSERRPLYSGVQRRIASQSYWAFLHQPRAPILASAKLRGLQLDSDRQWRLDEAYLTG